MTRWTGYAPPFPRVWGYRPFRKPVAEVSAEDLRLLFPGFYLEFPSDFAREHPGTKWRLTLTQEDAPPLEAKFEVK